MDFSTHPASRARARARLHEHRTIRGETFIGTIEAARCVGMVPVRLHRMARDYKGSNRVITLPNGWRFIRIPRHDGDARAPLYWHVGDR